MAHAPSKMLSNHLSIPHVVSLIFLFMSLISMSNLRNGHVALSSLGVDGHSTRGKPQLPAIGSSSFGRCQQTNNRVYFVAEKLGLEDLTL